MTEEAIVEDFLIDDALIDGILILIFKSTIKIYKYISQINILGKKRIMIFKLKNII